MTDFILRLRERHAQRKQAHSPCEVVADSGFRLLGRQLVDLSRTGMLLRCDEEIVLDELVYFSLRIPRARTWIDGTGRVSRIVHGNRNSDAGRCVGIRFDALDASYSALLNSTLRLLPPTEPARRMRRDYASTIQLISRTVSGPSRALLRL
jgi:hypothetical protein